MPGGPAGTLGDPTSAGLAARKGSCIGPSTRILGRTRIRRSMCIRGLFPLISRYDYRAKHGIDFHSDFERPLCECDPIASISWGIGSLLGVRPNPKFAHEKPVARSNETRRVCSSISDLGHHDNDGAIPKTLPAQRTPHHEWPRYVFDGHLTVADGQERTTRLEGEGTSQSLHQPQGSAAYIRRRTTRCRRSATAIETSC